MQKNVEKKICSIEFNEGERNAALLARLPKPVTAIRHLGNKKLMCLLDDCFSSIDDSLFELAKNSLTDQDNDDYFSAMTEIRGKRKNIQKNFVDELNGKYSQLAIPTREKDKVSSFSSMSVNDLAVVDYDDLDELVAKEVLISKTSRTFENPLNALITRIDSVSLANVNLDNLPTSPLNLCNIFVAAVKTINISTKPMLVFFKVFEKDFLDQLGSTYEQMNQVLRERGILPDCDGRPEQSRPHLKTQGQTSDAFAADPVQSQTDSGPYLSDGGPLSAAQSNSGYSPTVDMRPVSAPATSAAATTNSTPTISTPATSAPAIQAFDILQNLQAKLPAAQGTQGNYLSQLIDFARKKESAQFKLSSQEKSITTFLDNLFGKIDNSIHLSPPLKSLFQQLELPVAKAALNNTELLKSPKHSARQFLNALADAAMQCDTPDREKLENDQLFQKIQQTVRQLAEINTPKDSDFNDLLKDFRGFLKQDQHRTALFERRLISAEEGRLKTEEAQQKVDQTIAEVCQGMDIKNTIEKIIQQGWKQVMTVAALNSGFESEEWDNQVSTLIELVINTQSFVSDSEMEQAQTSKNQLKDSLTEGLESITFDRCRLEQLVEELDLTFRTLEKDWKHQKTRTSKASPRKNSVKIETKKLTRVMEAEDKYSQPENPGPEIAQAFYAQAKDLATGAWFNLTIDETSQRCRLAAVLKPQLTYIFVSRAGTKIANKNLEEVASMLQAGQLKFLDSNQIFDKALESVISGIKENQRPTTEIPANQ